MNSETILEINEKLIGDTSVKRNNDVHNVYAFENIKTEIEVLDKMFFDIFDKVSLITSSSKYEEMIGQECYSYMLGIKDSLDRTIGQYCPEKKEVSDAELLNAIMVLRDVAQEERNTVIELQNELTNADTCIERAKFCEYVADCLCKLKIIMDYL